MRIWYDVSDLADWQLAHVTGIQRVVTGVLGGLRSNGVRVELVKFDRHRREFTLASMDELPVTVREAVLGAEFAAVSDGRAAAAVRTGDVTVLRSTRDSGQGTQLGQPPEAAALRSAMRDFSSASKQLRKQLRRWAKARIKALLGAGRGSGASGARGVETGVDAASSAMGPMAPGDVLISLGATWAIDQHSETVKGLRSRGVRVVRMLYDLIPTLKPHWVDDPDAGVYHSPGITAWARCVLAESDLVLTISEFSRLEIDRYCRSSALASAPVSVVRLGDQLTRQHLESLPAPRFRPVRPFFICVCSIDVRKNHRLLYDAWTVLASRKPEGCPDLLCIGHTHIGVKDLLREIKVDPEVNGRIHFVSKVPDSELEWYYQHCVATVYPSRYEGWGLPVAESLARGRLVLSSNAASMPEISRELPCFFDPLDVHGLVGLVERVIAEPGWVREREAAIREKFVPTSWNDTAAQVMQGVADACRTS